MENSKKKRRFRYPAWTPEWVKLLIRVGYRISIIGIVLFLITAVFYWILASQYDLDKVAQIPDQNIILADDGNKLAKLDGYGRRLISSGEINNFTKNALLAREDTRFESHHGIDLRGLGRATLKNLKSLSFKEGASTISMQLTKNTYNNKSKSIHRKLLEIAITLRVESRYDKEEIMTHYLNRIYFGSGCYGIEEAAQTYFGKTTKDLSLAQAALIVGIIRGPHIFSPFNDLEKAIDQRDQVLARMSELDFITSEQEAQALIAPLGLIDKSARIAKSNSSSSYAVKAIIRHYRETIDSALITEGGLQVASTINRKLLQKINHDLHTTLPKISPENDKPLQVAVVVIENATGAIKALIGGRDSRKYPYNRALDSKQELGKAFYPFLYLAALERGKLPLANQPIITGKQIGYRDLLTFCDRYGITHQPAKLAEDLYRGSIYASPLQLANAFSILRNSGNRADSYFIESIHNKEATELFSHSEHNKPVASRGSCHSCLSLLEKQANSKTITLTAFSYKHAWLIASTKDLTAVLWLGHDLPADIPNKKQLTSKLQQQMIQWVK